MVISLPWLKKPRHNFDEVETKKLEKNQEKSVWILRTLNSSRTD
jgi:hypothetical protein